MGIASAVVNGDEAIVKYRTPGFLVFRRLQPATWPHFVLKSRHGRLKVTQAGLFGDKAEQVMRTRKHSL
jgi:hypothetical protein